MRCPERTARHSRRGIYEPHPSPGGAFSLAGDLTAGKHELQASRGLDVVAHHCGDNSSSGRLRENTSGQERLESLPDKGSDFGFLFPTLLLPGILNTFGGFGENAGLATRRDKPGG